HAVSRSQVRIPWSDNRSRIFRRRLRRRRRIVAVILGRAAIRTVTVTILLVTIIIWTVAAATGASAGSVSFSDFGPRWQNNLDHGLRHLLHGFVDRRDV